MEQSFGALHNLVSNVLPELRSYVYQTTSEEELAGWLNRTLLKYFSHDVGESFVEDISSQQQVVGSAWVPIIVGNQITLQWTCVVCTCLEDNFVCKVFEVFASTLVPPVVNYKNLGTMIEAAVRMVMSREEVERVMGLLKEHIRNHDAFRVLNMLFGPSSDDQ